MHRILWIIGVLVVLLLALWGLMSLGTHSGLSHANIVRTLPGDEVIADPWIRIDRGATLAAPAEVVWPWVKQLGKDRAGWYAPMWLENLLRLHSAASIVPAYQDLSVGQVVPDWGGGVLKVLTLDEGHAVVYGSLRPENASSSDYAFTWALVVDPIDASHSLFQLRLSLKKPAQGMARFIPPSLPGLIDYATDVVMFAGLKEKVKTR
ncbi:MAG: hypothetical protein JWO84_144 [Parcubacteria group bacterium]|nr:hypothetical protein [Parcubacteria group bacterium]